MGQVIFFVEDLPGGGLKAKALGYPLEVRADDADELEINIHSALLDFFKEDTCHYLVKVTQEPQHDSS